MKKIITPIVYLFFAFVVFILNLFAIAIYDTLIGVHPFFGLRWGTVESLIIFILVTVPAMYFGNYLIQKIDQLKKPVFIDHFRQASLCYVAFFYYFISWLRWYK